MYNFQLYNLTFNDNYKINNYVYVSKIKQKQYSRLIAIPIIYTEKILLHNYLRVDCKGKIRKFSNSFKQQTAFYFPCWRRSY